MKTESILNRLRDEAFAASEQGEEYIMYQFHLKEVESLLSLLEPTNTEQSGSLTAEEIDKIFNTYITEEWMKTESENSYHGDDDRSIAKRYAYRGGLRFGIVYFISHLQDALSQQSKQEGMSAEEWFRTHHLDEWKDFKDCPENTKFEFDPYSLFVMMEAYALSQQQKQKQEVMCPKCNGDGGGTDEDGVWNCENCNATGVVYSQQKQAEGVSYIKVSNEERFPNRIANEVLPNNRKTFHVITNYGLDVADFDYTDNRWCNCSDKVLYFFEHFSHPTALQSEGDVHELKTWPEYFRLMIAGVKTFELRKADRDFKVGDRIDLMEYDPDKDEYTGNHCHRYITHILEDNPFMEMDGNVILSVARELPPPPKSGEAAKNTDLYYCSVCGQTPVDVHNGFDTCEICANKI